MDSSKLIVDKNKINNAEMLFCLHICLFMFIYLGCTFVELHVTLGDTYTQRMNTEIKVPLLTRVDAWNAIGERDSYQSDYSALEHKINVRIRMYT